ncbi:TPA: DMP19 family protein [Neisseria cinerea]
MIELTLPENIKQQEPSALLYTLVSAYLEYTAQNGDEALSSLSDEQHTLTAYCYLDSQVEEGGFVQLIASGYGEYIFRNPLADSLRRWRIKITPKIIDKAKSLYEKHGNAIESLADEGRDILSLRKLFPDFEEWDAEYFEAAEQDLSLVAEHIRSNWETFAHIGQV